MTFGDAMNRLIPQRAPIVDVPKTSVVNPNEPPHPAEVTVRFKRWHVCNQLKGYRKGDYAGFLRLDAEELVEIGAAEIVKGA